MSATTKSRLEYAHIGKKKKKGSSKGGNAQANDYWGWFKKYGSAIFLKQYGEEYRNKEPNHYAFITSLWDEARATPGGWEAWGKKNEVKRTTGEGTRESRAQAHQWGRVANDQPHHPGLRPYERDEPEIRVYEKQEPKKKKPSKRIHFMRHTPTEVLIRMRKMYDNFTTKLRIMMTEGVPIRGKFADYILRDIRCFVLVVHEHTSNIKGDRVCPAEVTLLTFSLSRGMQKVLSNVVKYEHSIVTDRDDLIDQEYDRLLESYDKTGIAAEGFIDGAANPEGVDVVNTEKLKTHLLKQLSEGSNKNVPILFLKENYNEAAGMLFTLFPDYWEHLENRFGFLEDMFRIYTRVQSGDSNVHPSCDYSLLPPAPCCPYHETVNRKSRGTPKECTLKKAVAELQCLFKDLHDAQVLDMGRQYDERRHQKCSEDKWDHVGPQMEWGQRKNQIPENDPLANILSSDEETDGSLDETVPVTRLYGGGDVESRRPASQTRPTDRQVQRGRAASPTHSDRGGGEGGKREEEARRHLHQKLGIVEDEALSRGDGGGNDGAFYPISNDRSIGGGGSVFGPRPAIVPERAAVQFGRGGTYSTSGVLIPYGELAGVNDSCPISSRFRGTDEEVFNAHRERREQRRLRDARNYEERETRNWERWAERERQTRGGLLLTPPKEGMGKGEKKMQEDSPNPEYFHRPSSISGFFTRGRLPNAAPLIVPVGQRDPSPPKEETGKEAAERLEDYEIAGTVQFLPRGSFDADFNKMFERMRVTPTFGPVL